MGKKDIISELSKFFSIKELVCNHTWNAFGDKSWQFLSKDYLHCLLVIRRDILKSPMTCNTWHNGGPYLQRGLRCNICDIPRKKTLDRLIYNSAHCMGQAGDFIVSGMTAEEARLNILKNKNMLPVNIRLEGGVSWVHFDIFDPGIEDKVYVFKA